MNQSKISNDPWYAKTQSIAKAHPTLEVCNCKCNIAAIEKHKVTRLSQGKGEDAVKAILIKKEEDFQGNVFSQLNNVQLDTLLK